MTTIVVLAYLLSAPPLAVILGHRLAGRSVVTTARELAASPRVRVTAFWVVAVAAGLMVAFATRGQLVTWDGVTAVPVR